DHLEVLLRQRGIRNETHRERPRGPASPRGELEPLLVEARDGRGMQPDDGPVRPRESHASREGPLDLIVESDRGADAPAAAAGGAWHLKRPVEGTPRALSSQLDEPEIAHRQEPRSRAVLAQLFEQGAGERLAVLRLDHVDEVDHDDPTEVPEAQEANDLTDRFEVGLARR